jgi:hypothetical protein
MAGKGILALTYVSYNFQNKGPGNQRRLDSGAFIQ